MLALTLAAALALAAQDAPPPGLVNGGFEDGQAAVAPLGWAVPTRDYRVETVDGGHEGERCVHLAPGDGKRTSPFGNVMQVVDAVPWRGRPVRLRAWVRVEGSGARAQMWLRVDREGKKMGLFDNMGDRPVLSKAWQECEITGVVDADAQALSVGVMLFGEGELWVDGVELAPTGAQLELAKPEPPRALTDAGLANLLAFAELFGYVRHFHPSDQAAAADWERVALEGVRAVEGAGSPAALAAALQAHFAPLAPAVRVFTTGTTPAAVPELERAPERGTILYWRHDGFGQKGGVYTSERARASAAAVLPTQVPDPAHPYAAELAGGVSCLVPLSLHADAQGTLPRPTAAAAEAKPLARATGDDRATRLADVVLAWNVFQHFYPYFDVTPVDWRAELEKALRSAATDDGERAFLDTLRRLVAALRDGHGYVNHACAAPQGFLPLDWDWIEGKLVVTEAAPGLAPHPAPGDVVLAIDGRPVAEELAHAEALISGATPQWIRVRAQNELRLRSTPAPCALELSTYPDDERVRVDVTPRTEPLQRGAPVPDKLAELEPGVWYVDLGRLVDAELEAAVESLADAQGIVFDLRGYPGGLAPQTIFGHLIEEPATSAQWCIPIVLRPNREQLAFGRGGEWRLLPREPYYAGKKAFLTGGGAISYAESCMAIVEHYRLAAIVGGTTAGTNGNVNPFVLPGGYSVSWTGMKVLKHDGSRHHGIGIRPTVPVERTRRGAAEGRDEVLERALAEVR